VDNEVSVNRAFAFDEHENLQAGAEPVERSRSIEFRGSVPARLSHLRS
jgi:hypothetical protein